MRGRPFRVPATADSKGRREVGRCSHARPTAPRGLRAAGGRPCLWSASAAFRAGARSPEGPRVQGDTPCADSARRVRRRRSGLACPAPSTRWGLRLSRPGWPSPQTRPAPLSRLLATSEGEPHPPLP